MILNFWADLPVLCSDIRGVRGSDDRRLAAASDPGPGLSLCWFGGIQSALNVLTAPVLLCRSTAPWTRCFWTWLRCTEPSRTSRANSTNSRPRWVQGPRVRTARRHRHPKDHGTVQLILKEPVWILRFGTKLIDQTRFCVENLHQQQPHLPYVGQFNPPTEAAGPVVPPVTPPTFC